MESKIVAELAANPLAPSRSAAARSFVTKIASRSNNPAIRDLSPQQSETLHKPILTDLQTQRTRPNLTHLGGGVEEIRELLVKRLPLYREVMTDELDVTNLSPEQAAEAIVKLIQPGSH